MTNMNNAKSVRLNQYMSVLTESIVQCVERTTLCSEITYLFGHPFFDDNDMVFGGQ